MLTSQAANNVSTFAHRQAWRATSWLLTAARILPQSDCACHVLASWVAEESMRELTQQACSGHALDVPARGGFVAARKSCVMRAYES